MTDEALQDAREHVRGLIRLSTQWSSGSNTLTSEQADAVINLLLEPENIHWLGQLVAAAAWGEIGT